MHCVCVCKLLYLLYIIVWVCLCGVSPELFTRSQDDATRGERSKKAIFVVASFILDNSQRHIQWLSPSPFLSYIHTHTLVQESASMFSKIEFLKIVLGKEATGNMKAPVEPTTLPAAQRHAPLRFSKRAHTHTHHTHTMCIWQFSLVVAHHQHLLFGTAPNRCSSRCGLFFCIPCNENCLVGCVSWL